MNDRPGTRLSRLAELLGGRVRGDESVQVSGIRSPREAKPHDLAYFGDIRYATELASSEAGAVLLGEDLVEFLDNGRPAVVVSNAQEALLALLTHFAPESEVAPGVHPTAVLGRNVSLGDDVSIGPYAVLGDGVSVGRGTRIGAHVVVGDRCTIGVDAILHPQVVLYPEVNLGNRVVLHAGCRVGVEGFGYVPGEDGIRRIPHYGPCEIGDDVEVGANTCIDRGSLDRTVLGAGSKLDNLVHIGHNVRVGRHTLMAALVGIAGSVEIGDGTMWGGQSGAVDHQVVGDGARIAGKTGVSSEVTAGSTVMGFPSRPHREHMKALAALYRLDDFKARLKAVEDRLGLDEPAEE